MFARCLDRNPIVFIRTGLVFLILASLWRLVVERRGLVAESIADGGGGLLYGITIGCFIAGLWLKARRD